MKVKNGKLVFKKKRTKINEFNFNEKIEYVEFSVRTRSISKMTFNGCRFLKTVKFNENISEIGYGAFLNCTSLEEVNIPAGVEILGEGAFMDCRSLKKVFLPPVKVLPKNLFKNCFSLEEIVIPDSVEIIEDGCFHGCTSLKNITFSSNLKEIKDQAFKRCQSLASVVFPGSLEKIGHKAFEDSKELRIIKINGNLSYIGKSVFHNCVYDESKITGTAFCSSFTSKEDIGNCITVTVPRTVTYLTLGYEGVLPFAYRNRNKTCPDHILSLEKEEVKVFMSSGYYSYSDDSDYIIKDNNFDFEKYDAQLQKAEETEKPFVAAFRLAYPRALSEYNEKVYFDLLKGYEKDVAFFSVEANDEKVLSYLLENFSFDTEFCSTLYSLCAKKGYANLQETLSLKKKKTALSETEALLNDLLLV